MRRGRAARARAANRRSPPLWPRPAPAQVDSIKDLVTDTNLECATAGITLQAMDSSHVALVALNLKCDGFEMYRCDRNISLGMNLVRPRGADRPCAALLRVVAPLFTPRPAPPRSQTSPRSSSARAMTTRSR